MCDYAFVLLPAHACAAFVYRLRELWLLAAQHDGHDVHAPEQLRAMCAALGRARVRLERLVLPGLMRPTPGPDSPLQHLAALGSSLRVLALPGAILRRADLQVYIHMYHTHNMYDVTADMGHLMGHPWARSVRYLLRVCFGIL